jgi:phage terminase small subunit
MPKSRRKLNDRQKLFCHEYLVDRNATQAAIRAGYSQKTAGSQAHDLLKKPEIREFIDGRLNKIAAKAEISVERITEELARILLADPIEAYNDNGTLRPLSEWPEDLRRALSGLETKEEMIVGVGGDEEGAVHVTITKAKFWSKTAASEQLYRRLGAFRDEKDAALAAGLAALLARGHELRGGGQ